MQVDDYFRSLSAELSAMKDRVRHMIDDGHWPTDGEWKESVLRSVLRRSAPSTLSIGRGFVVGNQNSTGQLDILIHDNSHPVLYRDGDLVFATAASCKAVIEVKTHLSRARFREACVKLGDAAQLVRSQKTTTRTLVGLFSYGVSQIDAAEAAVIANEAADGNPLRVVDHIALGDDIFLKYWDNNPNRNSSSERRERYRSWHAYRLRRMAAGYFIHNFLVNLSETIEPESDINWFPEQGKEVELQRVVALGSNAKYAAQRRSKGAGGN